MIDQLHVYVNRTVKERMSEAENIRNTSNSNEFNLRRLRTIEQELRAYEMHASADQVKVWISELEAMA